MQYSIRGTTPFGYLPENNYSNENYGRVVEGNARNSYGPFIDPELQRRPHRRTPMNMRRRKHGYQAGQWGGY